MHELTDHLISLLGWTLIGLVLILLFAALVAGMIFLIREDRYRTGFKIVVNDSLDNLQKFVGGVGKSMKVPLIWGMLILVAIVIHWWVASSLSASGSISNPEAWRGLILLDACVVFAIIFLAATFGHKIRVGYLTTGMLTLVGVVIFFTYWVEWKQPIAAFDHSSNKLTPLVWVGETTGTVNGHPQVMAKRWYTSKGRDNLTGEIARPIRPDEVGEYQVWVKEKRSDWSINSVVANISLPSMPSWTSAQAASPPPKPEVDENEVPFRIHLTTEHPVWKGKTPIAAAYTFAADQEFSLSMNHCRPKTIYPPWKHRPVNFGAPTTGQFNYWQAELIGDQPVEVTVEHH